MSSESPLYTDSTPAWVTQTQEIYSSSLLPDKILKNLYTGITRGQTAAAYIEKAIAPNWQRGKELTIITIGVGMETQTIIQSYEPYILHARMKSLDIPHSLICIDKQARPLQTLRDRRTIFFFQSNSTSTFEWSSWHRLLRDLSQSDTEIHTEERELEFLSTVARTKSPYSGGTAALLHSGFRKTDVPESFIQKLQDQTITLLQEDIIMSDPMLFAQAHLVVCSNVLIGLPKNVQQVGLWNMTRHLQRGSHLLINDGDYEYVRSMRKDRGGWMDEDVLRDVFGVTAETLYEDPSYAYSDILLTKI